MMTNETTINKLIEMRLTTLADTYRLQLADSSIQELSFEDLLRQKRGISWRLSMHAITGLQPSFALSMHQWAGTINFQKAR